MVRPSSLFAAEPRARRLRPARLGLALLLIASLSACGGGPTSAAAPTGGAPHPVPAVPAAPALPAVDTRPVPVADPGSRLPEGWMHRGILQVFVRAFQDSDGDGIGDLRGLTQRLDYIRDLGVGGIWLLPINPSQDGDHGYAVTDYRAVDPQYGTLADFDDFVRAAHARGLGVILDHVINHSAAQHPAFLNSRASADNPFRDWYLWTQGARPTGWSIYGGNPWHPAATGWYFGAFWDQMPDFNLRNPAVLAWHHDHLRFWLNRGVDGFRFDAVGHLIENGPTAWDNQPENYPLMGDIRRLINGYANRWLVCESPADGIGFARDEACGSAFAFRHNGDLIRAAGGDAQALARVATHPHRVPPTMATFLANHDRFAGDRLWDQFGGDTPAYRLAAALLLLQPGVPFVYYGEEIGLAQTTQLRGDPALRTPMSWTADASTAGFTSGTPFRVLSDNVRTHNVAAQQADPGSLLSHYRGLLALRGQRPSLARGSYAHEQVDGAALAFARDWGQGPEAEQSWVAVNTGAAARSLDLRGLTPGARYAPVWHWAAGGVAAPGFAADAEGRARLTLPPHAAQVFARQTP
jgi:alpha-amylase